MIYLTGDTHGKLDKRLDFFKSLTKDDTLIILGDFGFNWTSFEENVWNIQKFPFTTLSVLGNHENYNKILNYPVADVFGGKAYKFNDNTFYLKHGEFYNIENREFFCFGGAYSIDKAWRTPYRSWWPEEEPTMKDYNHAIEKLKENQWSCDYIITHETSDDISERFFKYNDRIKTSTAAMIRQLFDEIEKHNGSYTHHYFAHHHRFASDDKHTCLYDQVLNLTTNELKTFSYEEF